MLVWCFRWRWAVSNGFGRSIHVPCDPNLHRFLSKWCGLDREGSRTGRKYERNVLHSHKPPQRSCYLWKRRKVWCWKSKGRKIRYLAISVYYLFRNKSGEYFYIMNVLWLETSVVGWSVTFLIVIICWPLHHICLCSEYCSLLPACQPCLLKAACPFLPAQPCLPRLTCLNACLHRLDTKLL